MMHWAVLSIMIILITGSVALVFAFVMYLKERNALFGYHLTMILLWTILVLVTQSAFYMNHFRMFPHLIPRLRLLSNLVFCALVARSILVAYPAKITLPYRIAGFTFNILGILMGLVAIAFFFFFSDHFYIARNIIGVIWISGLTVNLLIVLFEKNPMIYHEGVNWNLYTKVICFLSIAQAPVVLFIMSRMKDTPSALPFTFLIYPGYYFIMQVFFIIFILRAFMKPHYQIKPVSIRPSTAGRYGLSDREVEIAARLIEGMSYDSIGESLFISRSTVKTHVTSIYRKTGVKRQQDLVRILQNSAVRNGK